jgi:N-acetylglucosaminyl-diphospho-decaprenol L-rhamnosyltransferase
MTLSVVIVSWNVCAMLRECLRSVYEEASSVDGLEVYVVDNASSDGSVEMVRAEFPLVKLIVNHDNEGFAKANNQAAQACCGRYVVLLNPDTVVKDRALVKLVHWMDAHARAGIAGCRLLNTDGSLQRWTGGAFPNLCNIASHHLFLDYLLPARVRPRPMYRLGDTSLDERVDWVSGACLIARRRALRQRLFDESYFMYAEDLELCERLAVNGWEIWYVPSAVVVHHHGRSMSKQSGTVTLSPVRGPRIFFARGRSPVALLLYDILTTTGYFLRWVAFSALSRARSRERYHTRAQTNRQLMSRALRVSRGR